MTRVHGRLSVGQLLIGRYDRSTALTYLGLSAAVLGMIQSIAGDFGHAVALLAAAGLCDLFDGPIARRYERTQEAKRYGVELDSLTDVMAFVALPACLLLSMSKGQVSTSIVAIVYSLAGVVRLAAFGAQYASLNTTTAYYLGLPVTYIALVLPALYVFLNISQVNGISIFVSITMTAMAAAFVGNFRVAKPAGLMVWLLAIVVFALGAVSWLMNGG